MERTRRGGPGLAFGLGVLLVIVVVVLAEAVCGVLFRLQGPLPLSRPPRRDAQAFPEPHPSSYGVFPPPPSLTQAPLAAKGSAFSRSEDTPCPYDDGRAQVEHLRISSAWKEVGPSRLGLPCRSYSSLRTLRSGEFIWKRDYTIDPFCRRRTPGEAAKTGAERFIVLLGDSAVFGEGLADDETVAAYLGARLPRQRVYNYAFTGAFPGEILERARLIRGFPKELKERRGTVYYFHTPYHVLRNMGALTVLNEFGTRRPLYREDGSGRIVRAGSFREARPSWTLAVRVLRRSNIVRYFSLELKPRDRDFRFACRIIQEAKRVCAGFGADRFFVVLPPSAVPDAYAAFIPYLEEAGIHYIHFSRWRGRRITRGPGRIPKDGHPTAEYNEVLGRALAEVSLVSDRPRQGRP